ncbi:hypothetical protein L7F22_065593 [Adiantum nelumboides]|nr:hypothetical protein [Adiantum nelumboides]
MGEQDNNSKDDVRTLFISGLPDDVKEREIYNLFRAHRGYEACQLKYTGRGYQIVAFAVFSDQESALAAKDALNETKFDPELSTTLHIELARANSRSKRHRGDDGNLFSMEKKSRGPKGVSHVLGDHGVGGTMHLSGYGHSVYGDLSGYPPTQSGAAPYGVHDGLSSVMMSDWQGTSMMPPLPPTGGNLPCSTLFVANLGLSCTETELYHLLSSFPGFIKLKMQTKAGLPVAFVDFQDEACSTQALSQLQNYVLPSSDRGGMRLEYAKARMGLPRRERRP